MNDGIPGIRDEDRGTLDLLGRQRRWEAVEHALSHVRGLIRQGNTERVEGLVRHSRTWYEGGEWS